MTKKERALLAVQTLEEVYPRQPVHCNMKSPTNC